MAKRPCAMAKLSPVLHVDAIEPALQFWCERLGFAVVVSVPAREGAEALGFAILQQGAVEVMLQTRASVAEDIPALAREPNRAVLYVEVEDVDAVERALRGREIVVPRRRTFYGADEVGARAPGGHVVIFAKPAS